MTRYRVAVHTTDHPFVVDVEGPTGLEAIHAACILLMANREQWTGDVFELVALERKTRSSEPGS